MGFIGSCGEWWRETATSSNQDSERALQRSGRQPMATSTGMSAQIRHRGDGRSPAPQLVVKRTYLLVEPPTQRYRPEGSAENVRVLSL
jgi:hypothetical protein